MPTRQGALVTAGAVALALAGRMLGAVELYVLAAGAGALQVVALLTARLRRPRLEVARHVRPARVHAGGDSRVELVVRNLGRRSTPVVALRDPFGNGVPRRQARFLVAPLRAGQVSRAAYRLPTERRGLFRIGPLELQVTDPFGLAARTTSLAAAAELIVYPRVDPVTPLDDGHGRHPQPGGRYARSIGASGDDFFGLRAYEVGDDLRRVHWPSTARLDDLMIRQHEVPHRGRTTVLLDLRARAHDAESVEVAVSAAASILLSSVRAGSLVRLVVTDGFDSGYGTGHAHVDAVMERLAVAQAGDDRLRGVLGRLHQPGNGGAVAAVVTSAVPAADLERLSRLHTRFGDVTMVVLERAGDASRSARPPTPRAVRAVVRVPTGGRFADCWNAARPSSSPLLAGHTGR